MADKKQALEADRMFLLDRRSDWVDIDCVACGSDQSRPFGSKRGFDYVSCVVCGTVYTNPRPSDTLLKDYYRQSQNYAYWNEHIFPATENSRKERIFRPRALRLRNEIRARGIEPGTLLEIGSAFGTFLEEARQLALFRHIIGLEPTPDLAETCRSRGFDVIEDNVESLTLNEIADVIAAFEVIEHVACPEIFLENIRKWLNPNGMLVLTCPNVRGFDVSTLGTLSNTFEQEHLNYFHPESIELLLTRMGFQDVRISTPGRLDAELVRNQLVEGRINLNGQPFLEEILVNKWDELGQLFQDFIAVNNLSSHMMTTATLG